MPWLSNKGQAFQILLALLSVVLATIKAWGDIKNSKLFTAGTINLYLLLLLLVVIIINIYWIVSSYRPVTTVVHSDDQTREIVRAEVTSIDPPTADPKIVYKTKLRCVLKNVSNETIDVQRAVWVTTQGGVGTQTPFKALYQVENSPGSWQKGDWNKQELDVAQVKPGETFRVWLGLDPSASRDWLEQRRNSKQLGTLLLPVKIGKEEYKVETPI